MIFTSCYEGKHRKCPRNLRFIAEWITDTEDCSCECHREVIQCEKK